MTGAQKTLFFGVELCLQASLWMQKLSPGVGEDLLKDINLRNWVMQTFYKSRVFFSLGLDIPPIWWWLLTVKLVKQCCY